MPAGRPKYKPTEADRNAVRVMAAGGIPRERIAACIGDKGIAPHTLAKHFSAELETSTDRATAVAIGSLFEAVKRGEPWAVCFWLKTRAGWRETNRMELTGANGGSVKTQNQLNLVPTDNLLAAIALLTPPRAEPDAEKEKP